MSEWMSGSPWLAFFLLLSVVFCIEAQVNNFIRLCSRWMRHRNIAARGWPPPHLDADGDWKPNDDQAANVEAAKQ